MALVTCAFDFEIAPALSSVLTLSCDLTSISVIFDFDSAPAVSSEFDCDNCLDASPLATLHSVLTTSFFVAMSLRATLHDDVFRAFFAAVSSATATGVVGRLFFFDDSFFDVSSLMDTSLSDAVLIVDSVAASLIVSFLFADDD